MPLEQTTEAELPGAGTTRRTRSRLELSELRHLAMTWLYAGRTPRGRVATQANIAEELGLNQSQVCKLLKAAQKEFDAHTEQVRVSLFDNALINLRSASEQLRQRAQFLIDQGAPPHEIRKMLAEHVRAEETVANLVAPDRGIVTHKFDFEIDSVEKAAEVLAASADRHFTRPGRK